MVFTILVGLVTNQLHPKSMLKNHKFQVLDCVSILFSLQLEPKEDRIFEVNKSIKLIWDHLRIYTNKEVGYMF